MHEENLELCPCGGKAKLSMEFDEHPIYWSPHGWYFIECLQCGKRGAMKRTEQEAVDNWNMYGGADANQG